MLLYNELVERAAQLLLTNNQQLLRSKAYEYANSFRSEEAEVYLAAFSAITANIFASDPFDLKIRNKSFLFTPKRELAFKDGLERAGYTDVKFIDPDFDIHSSRTGKSESDIFAVDRLGKAEKFEAKNSYSCGTVSSLHDATKLADIDDFRKEAYIFDVVNKVPVDNNGNIVLQADRNADFKTVKLKLQEKNRANALMVINCPLLHRYSILPWAENLFADRDLADDITERFTTVLKQKWIR